MATIAQTVPKSAAAPTYRTVRASRVLALTVGVLVILGGIIFLALTLGNPQLTLNDLVGIIFNNQGDRLSRIVVLQLRLPRLALGLTGGAMLALAGTMLQDSLRNPLAGPELLGVSAGASVVMAIITIFSIPLAFQLYPVAALLGGVASGTIVILSMRRLGDSTRLVLMGVAVSALLYAAIIAIVSLGQQNQVGLFYLYVLGSIANRTWNDFNIIWPWAAVCIPLALLMARSLNLLQLGDEMAEGLGLKVDRVRFLIAVLSAGLVASVVAVCGPIGYIALVCPHIVRRALRTTDARAVLPLAALLGATLLTGADLLAKNLFFPIELPVGIWTTAIGGPLLILMLRRELGRRREGNG
jgi:iron complex transport system permease protein